MWSNSDDLAASAKLGKTTHPHSVKKLLPPLAYHVPQENNWRLGHICQEHWGEAMADAFRGICNFRHHKLSEIESYFEGFRYTEPGSSSQVDDNGCLYKLYIYCASFGLQTRPFGKCGKLIVLQRQDGYFEGLKSADPSCGRCTA